MADSLYIVTDCKMDMPEVGNYVESNVTCVNDVTVKRDGADCNGSTAYFKEIKNEKRSLSM